MYFPVGLLSKITCKFHHRHSKHRRGVLKYKKLIFVQNQIEKSLTENCLLRSHTIEDYKCNTKRGISEVTNDNEEVHLVTPTRKERYILLV